MTYTRNLFLCAAVFASLLAAASRPDMLVSTDWLAGHLTDPNVVVVHVSRDRAAWDTGHIPGARFLALAAKPKTPLKARRSFCACRSIR